MIQNANPVTTVTTNILNFFVTVDTQRNLVKRNNLRLCLHLEKRDSCEQYVVTCDKRQPKPMKDRS